MRMTGAPPRQAGFALQQARVCLDCDCLTLEQSCPWCDRDGRSPWPSWFRPMEERKADAPRQRGSDAAGRPAVDPHRPAPSAGAPPRPSPGAGRDRRGGPVRAPRRPAPPHCRRAARRGTPRPGSPAASAERDRLPGCSRAPSKPESPARPSVEPRGHRGRPAAPPPARLRSSRPRPAPSPELRPSPRRPGRQRAPAPASGAGRRA